MKAKVKTSACSTSTCSMPMCCSTLTFQHLIVTEFAVRQFSVTEYFPHQHSKGPHIRLGGEVVLKHRLCWEPAQWDPCLSVVVVLATQKYTKQVRQRCKQPLLARIISIIWL